MLVPPDASPRGSLQLLFAPLARPSALDVLRVEEVRPLLAALATLNQPPRARLKLRLLETPEPGPAGPPPWEARLREEFLSSFGGMLLPIPSFSLLDSRFALALKLSTRYMGEGIRQAAYELFTSPVFLAGTALSVLFYFAAWLAPEPFFTKLLAILLTARLSLVVGLVELAQTATAFLLLYQEAEAATTPEQLEAASARFA